MKFTLFKIIVIFVAFVICSFFIVDFSFSSDKECKSHGIDESGWYYSGLDHSTTQWLDYEGDTCVAKKIFDTLMEKHCIISKYNVKKEECDSLKISINNRIITIDIRIIKTPETEETTDKKYTDIVWFTWINYKGRPEIIKIKVRNII